MAFSSSSASVAGLLLSDAERNFIQASCRADCRLDGRSRLQFREYFLEQNDPLPLCHGSARLWSSGLHLLSTIKAELVRPSATNPNQGVVEVHVQGRVGTGAAKRRLEHVQTTLRELTVSHTFGVDVNALCVEPGKHVWKLAVDIFVLEEASGGSLVDTSARVALAALQCTRLPLVTVTHHKEDMKGATTTKESTLLVDSDWNKSVGVLFVDAPESCLVVTIAVLVDWDPATQRPLYSHIADATAAEEACATALVHVCLQAGQVVGISMSTHQTALPLTQLPELTQTAEQVFEAVQQAYTLCTPLRTTPMSSLDANHTTLSHLLQESFQWQPAEMQRQGE